MSSDSTRFSRAIAAFDAYHQRDPDTEAAGGRVYPKELLYVQRLTDRLSKFAPDADEVVKLAARCQHIGRWEIPREKYPMDRKGYLQWRNEEKTRHAGVAERILKDCGYEPETIEKVRLLLLKKELFSNPHAQLLEDVVCHVFVEYYLDDFAKKHDDGKVVDILRKTLKKMSARGREAAKDFRLSDRSRSLFAQAVNATGTA